MEKNEIIGHIHTLVSNNVIGDKQAMSRYKGFRGELFLDSYMKEKYPSRQYFEGGMIISKDSVQTSLDNALYLCVIEKSEYNPDYIKILTCLSGIGFEKMILVLYDEEKWEIKPVMVFDSGSVSLPVPDIEVYEFSISENKFNTPMNNIDDFLNFFESYKVRSRNIHEIKDETFKWLQVNLSQFSESQLLKIYMNRLFLDGFIGFGKKKGKPSDIDMIVKNSEGKFSLIEIKEKDLPKKNKKGFGLDIPRLNDMIRISKQTGLDYFLIVREVNNQTDRELIGYKYISIRDFEEDARRSQAVTGGTGMRSESTINDTLICSYNLFRDL
ncbi:hypothetical protein HZP42_01045 [Elizabethkingia anophelis]|uniref:hypothetical protein n=1 Tax=Elizabethkingia anophelis TaxID=1117645 RepID=UPI0009993C06|nr:hypothetical protein [Elizabethkingia anophelis]MCT4234963.1 hypothetical protein [Elizabethkingia anophelis]OPC30727.1 hypothetical protein BAX98_08965 [Elizabethkingia anophelis]